MQTTFPQVWQKKLVGISKEEKRISLLGVSFGKGFINVVMLYAREIDTSNIYEIEDVV
jgi:hypothetical protein